MRIRLLAALAAAVLLAACGSGGQESAAGLLSGTSPTVDGGALDLAEYAGQDVILWFWAPW